MLRRLQSEHAAISRWNADRRGQIRADFEGRHPGSQRRRGAAA